MRLLKKGVDSILYVDGLEGDHRLNFVLKPKKLLASVFHLEFSLVPVWWQCPGPVPRKFYIFVRFNFLRGQLLRFCPDHWTRLWVTPICRMLGKHSNRSKAGLVGGAWVRRGRFTRQSFLPLTQDFELLFAVTILRKFSFRPFFIGHIIAKKLKPTLV